jgi:hypothetical protein
MTREEWGYVVWGLVAVAILIPELLAIVGKSFVPFPGLARTATNIEARLPWVAMIFLAGFAILAVHIVSTPGLTCRGSSSGSVEPGDAGR